MSSCLDLENTLATIGGSPAPRNEPRQPGPARCSSNRDLLRKISRNCRSRERSEPEGLEAMLEAAPKRRARDDAFPSHRLHEAKRGRVQPEAIERVALPEQAVVFTLTVTHVADERAGQVLQVSPDLVQPAGLWQREH